MVQTHPARTKLSFDNWLFGATLALMVFGLWMVFDSSYAKTLDNVKLHNDAFYYLRKQMLGVIVGIPMLFIMMRTGYWNMRRHSIWLMGAAIVMLIAVYVPHIGVRENNASRWIAIGPLPHFQPSEFAKIALILYLSAYLSRANCKIRDFSDGLAGPLCVSLVFLILIEREPDLGTAAVLFMTVITLFFLAGARKRHLALIMTCAALAVALLGFGFGHRAGRMTVFLNPKADKTGIGYQVYHSELAIGSGGWLGAGFGRGREKYYLPQGDTDFIFATVAEEFGFFRTSVLLLFLVIVAWRGFKIARECKDRFGSLLAAGITSLICWQALVNIAVTTASIPATGVPLPFISFGSSSLVLFLSSVGILLSIAQNPMPPTLEKKKSFRQD